MQRHARLRRPVKGVAGALWSVPRSGGCRALAADLLIADCAVVSTRRLPPVLALYAEVLLSREVLWGNGLNTTRAEQRSLPKGPRASPTAAFVCASTACRQPATHGSCFGGAGVCEDCSQVRQQAEPGHTLEQQLEHVSTVGERQLRCRQPEAHSNLAQCWRHLPKTQSRWSFEQPCCSQGWGVWGLSKAEEPRGLATDHW